VFQKNPSFTPAPSQLFVRFQRLLPATPTLQDKDMPDVKMQLTTEHARILEKIKELYYELFLHDGFGELKIEMKFLKKKQKEIIIRCGKDFRFVVDYDIHTDPYSQH